MSAKITFDKSSKRYFGFLNGKIIVRSHSEEYAKRKIAEAGGDLEAKPKEAKVQFSVNERFDFVDDFVGLIAQKKINSFVIVGRGGIGKTHSVITGLKAAGLKEETAEDAGDYMIVKGYSTPKYLYRLMYENNGKILVLDDCDQAFKDPIAANLLKAALEDAPARTITWGAEFAKDEELPNRFQYFGRVVFISNLDIDQFPQAIISRSAKINLALTTEETVDRIIQVFKSIDAPQNEKADVIDFIKKYADVASDLNIRSSLNLLKMRKNFGEKWLRPALYQWAN